MTQNRFGPSTDYNPGQYIEVTFTYNLEDGTQHFLVVRSSHKMMKMRVFNSLEEMTAKGFPNPTNISFKKIEDEDTIASIVYEETMVE
jgi:diaminopimelate epimerase